MLISIFLQLEIEFYFENVCTHIGHVTKVKAGKYENNRPLEHLFFYRLWHMRSFIHFSLNIIYGFHLDTSMYRLALIQPY